MLVSETERFASIHETEASFAELRRRRGVGVEHSLDEEVLARQVHERALSVSAPAIRQKMD